MSRRVDGKGRRGGQQWDRQQLKEGTSQDRETERRKSKERAREEREQRRKNAAGRESVRALHAESKEKKGASRT